MIETANSSQALEPLNELITDLKEQKTSTIAKVTESVKSTLLFTSFCLVNLVFQHNPNELFILFNGSSKYTMVDSR